MKRLVTSPIILAGVFKRASFFAASVGIVLLSTSAQADMASYPKYVKELSGAAKDPACNLCHSSGSGPAMGTPFGDAIKKAGLGGTPAGINDADAMKPFFDKLGDSDGGGKDDVDELKDGSDPNKDADDEDDGGSGGKAGGGSGGSGNSGTGAGGSGGSGTGTAGTPVAAGAAGGGADNGSQATSAGCSYGPLETSSSNGLLLLAGLGGVAAAYARRRNRRLEATTLTPRQRTTLWWRVGALPSKPVASSPSTLVIGMASCPSRAWSGLSQTGLSGDAGFARSR